MTNNPAPADFVAGPWKQWQKQDVLLQLQLTDSLCTHRNAQSYSGWLELVLGEWLPDSALTSTSTSGGAWLAPLCSLRAKLDLNYSEMEAKLSLSAQRGALVMGNAKERDYFYEQVTDMEWLGIPLLPRVAVTPAHPTFLLNNKPGINKTCCLGEQSNLHLLRSWLYLPEQPVLGNGLASHQARSLKNLERVFGKI